MAGPEPDLAPLILTLTLDPAAQDRFDALRSAHFPADRLFVGAHTTLFHALPADLDIDLIRRTAATTGPFQVRVATVRFLGRGVALTLQSEPLLRMRDKLRWHWADRLTPQDRQAWQPHVTIQNKVAPDVARELHRTLLAGFVPYEVTATGLALWIYRNGPWQVLDTFPFQQQCHAS